MNCPDCGFAIDNNTSCPNCGLDIVFFKSINNISNSLYNVGLRQAQTNDLTGAVKSLSKSIYFNKNNYNARNLLGLVYFEIGYIGLALTEWVISDSIKKEDNIASEYIDEMHTNGRALEKMNDSVKMYNQALVYVRQKSEDMAIIQLKKAIDLNPKLLDAHNLLALCHMYTKNKTEANKTLEKVLAMDILNPIASRYYFELNNRAIPGKISDSEKSQAAYQRVNSRYARVEKPRSFFSLAWFFTFMAGVLCTAAAMYILVFPAQIDDKNNLISELEDKLSQERLSKESSVTELSAQVSSLESENKELKEFNDEYVREKAVAQNQNKITQAEYLYSRNNIIEALSALNGVDESIIPEDSKNDYEDLKAGIFTKAAQSYYSQGVTSYNRANYPQAKENLENALFYSKSENFISECLYLLGRVAEVDEDNQKALEYYERLISNYPNSQRAKTARTRSTRLQQ